MGKIENLIGTVVMVDPLIADFRTHGSAKIGLITAVDPHNEHIEVEFMGRWREKHAADALWTLKSPEEIQHSLSESKLKWTDKKIIIPIWF